MKHVFLWNYSRRSKRRFSASMLGDKVHVSFYAYQIGAQKNDQVTFHLNRNCHGDFAYTESGINSTKAIKQMNQWKEVEKLFPDDKFKIVFDEYSISTDKQIKERFKELNPQLYYYGKGNGINILDYFPNKVLLKPKIQIPTPEKFVTMQWDSTDPSRNIDKNRIDKIKQYYFSLGYDIIEIGIKQSLAEIACYLSKADYHIGVDSGMMHMAQMYMPYNKIYICTGIFKTPHTTRSAEFGSLVNAIG